MAATAEDLYELKRRLEELEARKAVSGVAKWFVSGSGFSIDDYPKHKTFFQLGSECRERVFLAANRSGKSTAGAF